jgi:hypothetical protein
MSDETGIGHPLDPRFHKHHPDDDPIRGSWVLVCWGMATIGQEGEGPIGEYLEQYDVEAHDGRGFASFTDDPAKAMRFTDISEAVTAWRTQSKVRPLREDGKPNRPLTAFSMEPRSL